MSCKAIEKIGSLTYTVRKTVLHRDDRGPPRAEAKSDVIETSRERIIDRQRATKPHAAIHREIRPTLQQQPNDLEIVLVPPHGDTVLGDTAEARHRPSIELLVNFANIAKRTERRSAAGKIDARQIAARVARS